MYMCTVEVT